MLIYFQSAQSLRRLNLMKFFKCLLCPRLAARKTALSQPRRQKHIGPNMSETYCWLFSTNTEVPKYSDQTLLKISD